MTTPITQTNNHKLNEKPPKYREGDNLQIFFKLYEKTAILNGWESHQAKLQHIHKLFKGKLQEWIVSQAWEAWDDFKNALLEREEIVIKDDMHYLNKLLNTKRKKYTTLNKFIIKFDNLMQERKIAQQRSNTTVDTDSFYMKLFIKNSSPADMRRHIKEKGDTKLTELYKIARAYENEDSSDEDSSDSSSDSDELSNSSDSDSDNDRKKYRKSKKSKSSKVKTTAPKLKTKEPTFKAALLTMIENQQTQLLLLQQQQQSQQTQPQIVHPMQVSTPQTTGYYNKRCYNCKDPNHFDANCPNPCKYCGSREHKRYICPQKPSVRRENNGNNNNASTSQVNTNTLQQSAVPSSTYFVALTGDENVQQALLAYVNADVLAMKRVRGQNNEQTKKRQKKNEDANANTNVQSSSTEIQMDDNTVQDPNTVIQVEDDDIQLHDVNDQASGSGLQQTNTKKSEGKKPMNTKVDTTKEFYEVVPDPLRVNRVTHATKTATVVAELRKQKVFTLSYDELISLSSKVHTEFRRTLASQEKLNQEQPKDYTGVLLNQKNSECILPEGNQAPRVLAKINGVEANLILDTGCTPCIISLNLVKRLGLEYQLMALSKDKQAGILVGDGRQVKTKGIIKDLQIELLPGRPLKVDALCLDVPEKAYEFLFGQIAMARFGVGADMATSNWYIRDGEQFEPLDVYHTAAIESDSCFVVTMGPVAPNEIESDKEDDKFKKLFANIDDNEMLTIDQKQEIKDLITRKSEAFGTGYKDLTQTNLLKFHVETGDAKPIYKRPYAHMSFSELELLKKEITEILEAGYLIPAMHSDKESPNSGWAFQVMFVPKKNGEKRLVTMFQDLNKVMVPDSWPLPNINNLLEAFKGSNYLSSLDMLKSFHQISCTDSTIPKLLITTPIGAFCYTVMPFGVRNGNSTFSRAIYLALKDFEFCNAYIDDNQVFSKSYEEHLKHLEMVFDRMTEAKNDKLDTNWLDKTFTVIVAYGNNTYQLVNNENGRPVKRKINGTKLKRYFQRTAERLPVVVCGETKNKDNTK